MFVLGGRGPRAVVARHPVVSSSGRAAASGHDREQDMKRFESIRSAAAIAALTVAPSAYADSGVTATGWISMLGVVAIAAVLFVVHKKLN